MSYKQEERIAEVSITRTAWVTMIGNMFLGFLMMLLVAWIFADVAYSIEESLKIIANNTSCS